MIREEIVEDMDAEIEAMEEILKNPRTITRGVKSRGWLAMLRERDRIKREEENRSVGKWINW